MKRGRRGPVAPLFRTRNSQDDGAPHDLCGALPDLLAAGWFRRYTPPQMATSFFQILVVRLLVVASAGSSVCTYIFPLKLEKRDGKSEQRTGELGGESASERSPDSPDRPTEEGKPSDGDDGDSAGGGLAWSGFPRLQLLTSERTDRLRPFERVTPVSVRLHSFASSLSLRPSCGFAIEAVSVPVCLRAIDPNHRAHAPPA